MADFEQAGATERLRSIAILRDMQRKLQRGALEALGLAAGASPAEIRAAFMGLTKQYHPAKFARLDDSTIRLANEVFLSLRDAYEAVRAASGGASAGGVRRLGTDPGASAEGGAAGAHRSAAPGSGTSADRSAERGDRGDRGAADRVTRPAQRPAAGAPPPNTSPSPSAAAADPPPRSASGTMLGQRLPGQRLPTSGGSLDAGRALAQPATSRPDRPDRPESAREAAKDPPKPAARPSLDGGRPNEPQRPTSGTRAGIGAAPRAGSAAPPLQIRFAPGSPSSGGTNGGTTAGTKAPTTTGPSSTTPPAGPPAGSANGPSRPSSASLRASAPRDAVSAPPGLQDLLDNKRWAQARALMQERTAKEPAERSHLAWLAYIKACEFIDSGETLQARRELVRALAIEPALAQAKATLSALNGPQGAPTADPTGSRR
ncbi:MAG: J domain-containing protein [Myxococcales bacterium]|nr:J domain-containing protein [Myxococcales bacterium]